MEPIIDLAHRVGSSLFRRLLDLPDDDSESTVAAVSRVMDEHLARLADGGCWGKANQRPSTVFWSAAEEILRRGSLQLHARTKPYGYAGDYVLLGRICRHDVQGRGLGRALDVYFQNHAAPRAVRGRALSISQAIQLRVTRWDEPQHLVSVGSGTAFELEWALRSLDAQCRPALRMTLLDLDPRALVVAEDALRPWMRPHDSLRTVHFNLNRLRDPSASDLLDTSADLVFCSGFFDYLLFPAAQATLQTFARWLSQQGECILFNFHPENPSRAYMEWIGNWYLQYRDEAEMHALVSHIPFDGACVRRDQTRASIYLHAWNGSTPCDSL